MWPHARLRVVQPSVSFYTFSFPFLKFFCTSMEFILLLNGSQRLEVYHGMNEGARKRVLVISFPISFFFFLRTVFSGFQF